MRRREFITLLGGAAAAWPLAARAQQPPTMPVIGYLHVGVPQTNADLTAAFRKGLAEVGYVEGRNVAIEYRFSPNDPARLPALAADLVRRRVAVIATPGGPVSTLAAKAVTSTIPIVFGTGGDPVQAGLVVSFNRPGGNVTGINSMTGELSTKQIGLLHELVPASNHLAALVNSAAPSREAVTADLHRGAAGIGRSIDVVPVASPRDLVAAFDTLAQNHTDTLLVASNPLFGNSRVQLAVLAARHGIPTIYGDRGYVEVGGLMSYGSSLADLFRQTGVYTGRVLKGEKPADLPVMRAVKFEMVINLKTAKALGLTIPETLLATADEVIR
jgi:putative ABC transport system substrate-binding protein